MDEKSIILEWEAKKEAFRKHIKDSRPNLPDSVVNDMIEIATSVLKQATIRTIKDVVMKQAKEGKISIQEANKKLRNVEDLMLSLYITGSKLFTHHIMEEMSRFTKGGIKMDSKKKTMLIIAIVLIALVFLG